MAKAGRPKYKFTPKQIACAEDLAFQGCQNGTIATLIGISKQLLEQRKDLLTLLTKKRAERKAWLRGIQNRRAMTDTGGAMPIFLGKNELDQSDRQEIKHDIGLTVDLAPELMALGRKMAEEYAKGVK